MGRGGGASCRLPPSDRAACYAPRPGSGQAFGQGPPPTQDQTVTITRHIHFEFDQDVVQTPLLYQMNREFDVVINIRGASVSERGGFIALELEGAEEEIARAARPIRFS